MALTIEDVPPPPLNRTAMAKTLKPLAPGYSTCLRCDMPWKFTEPHTTYYSDDRGCFPLCQTCWSVLTPEQRIPFYEKLVKQWYVLDPCCVSGAEAEAILGAVLKGL